MKTRTNNTNALRTSKSTLGIALAGLTLALTPVASLAAGPVTGAEATTTKISDRRVAQGEEAVPPRHISADYNHSGMVDIDDLFSFLTDWFAGKGNADTNLNGVLEIQDVIDYVNLWLGAYGTKGEDPRQ